MRLENVRAVAENPGAIPALLDYYGDGHWSEFISDWGWTFDPRELDPGLRTRPFILYPKQDEYVRWVYERYQKKQRGLAKKFRGAGASWLDAALGVVMWRCIPETIITMGSQKQEKVDNGDSDPDSLLWKVRKFVELLPPFFQPEDWRKKSKQFTVVNPENGSVIRGEIGDQIGRGGRATIAIADEFAELEHPQRVESALAENANTVLYVSTIPETGYVGSVFYQLEHQFPEEQLFIWRWTDDPRKRLRPDLPEEEEEWFKQKKRDLTPAVFDAQFLLTNTAATTNAFIPGGLITNAFRFSKIDIIQPENVTWRIGVDASGMGQDKSVIRARRGRLCLPNEVYEKMDGVQLALKVSQVAARCLETAPLGLIAIELDGPGQSCHDQLQYGPFSQIVAGVHTGTRLEFEWYNLRAWLHAQAKEWLQDGGYIPEDLVFEAQATAIQHSYKGGKLLIESKEEYRGRMSGGRTKMDKAVGKSPDRWDAFVLTFTPPVGDPIKTLMPSAKLFRGQAGNWALDPVMGY